MRTLQVHLAEPQLLLQVNPVDGRISKIITAKHPPSDSMSARGVIAMPNSTGWDGDFLVVDYFEMVVLENFMRDRRPDLKHSTIRRHLRQFVNGAYLNDMHRLRDGADVMELGLPWQGECEWLAKECARSAQVGRQMALVHRWAWAAAVQD
ncbi:MAG: hypothetical protein JKX86_07375 [Verrucomicrobiales bacterium]|nr:hypothetical protein [Verrucomicrobiales bacterium]